MIEKMLINLSKLTSMIVKQLFKNVSMVYKQRGQDHDGENP